MISKCLEVPSYGYEHQMQKKAPRFGILASEYLRQLDIFSTLKNWPIFTATLLFVLMNSLIVYPYFTSWFTLSSFSIALLVNLIEIYLWEAFHHRAFNHNNFKFTNKLTMLFCKHLYFSAHLDEMSYFSHLNHHRYSDQQFDPAWVRGGFWYMYFSSANQSRISRSLNRDEYESMRAEIAPFLLYTNSYDQYLRWGTIAHPFFYLLAFFVNLFLKFSIFFILFSLSTAMAYLAVKSIFLAFALTVGNLGVHRPQKDGSFSPVNSWFGILFFGSWHKNHHDNPRTAKSGGPKSIDIPYLALKLAEKIGFGKILF